HEGAIPIVNGWGTPRGRFNMVVEIRLMETGSISFCHIQGYTSHFDTSYNGNPDPDMVFFINSYTRVSRVQIMTPNGIEDKEVITESAQVINGRMIHSQLNHDIYGMRPNEIYSVMQSNVFRGNVSHEGFLVPVVDNRHNFSTIAVPSARSNNLSSNMLSRVIDSHIVSSKLSDMGQGNDDIISRSKAHVYEGSLSENAFFRRLYAVTGIPESTTFTLSHLRAIDPNVDSPDVSRFIVPNAVALREMNTAGQSESWHRPNDQGAWASSILANAVPTIMMDLSISQLRFSATNHDSMGVNNILIEYARSIVGGDMSHVLHVFRGRFFKEVMYDLTYSNSELYRLVMAVDLLGDTVIDIAYGSNPMTRYVTASFCDSLMIPVVTPNESLLTNMVHDFTQIINRLDLSNSGKNAVNELV
ncbi:MAG TPA: hypothetical protein VN843_01475, partial [Anaerolineales bacterium]|nr:hypothetical protein [Anaerolineales bacterium]